MNKEKQERINKNLDDVIDTSKKMRDYLLDETIPDEEKKERLKVIKTALEANKNIVSASCVIVNIENLVK
jgi:hypothetical protein